VVYIFVRIFAGIQQEFALEVTRSREEAAIMVERQRIAREMHDSIAQALFYSTTKLREVRGLVVSGEGERACDELRTVEEHIKDAHRQVRAVITSLKQHADLEDLGEAVYRAVNELAGHLGMRVGCEVERGVVLPASSRQHLVAIIQEALTNAHRHGGVRYATVRV